MPPAPETERSPTAEQMLKVTPSAAIRVVTAMIVSPNARRFQTSRQNIIARNFHSIPLVIKRAAKSSNVRVHARLGITGSIATMLAKM